MNFPDFFNKIPTIKLQDNLSDFLGTFEDGIVEFSYLDIIKSAGHSCPTVLGAYLMTYKALNFLYENELPKRGDIKVEFADKQSDGVTGVISNVVSNITGATFDSGFKGIAGNFDRRNLMFFEREINSNIRFSRRDTGKKVDVFYNISDISMSERLQELMKKSISKNASIEEQKEFGKLWQQRVENIFLNMDKVIKIES